MATWRPAGCTRGSAAGTSNGRILLEDVDGQVSMLTSNGSIHARNLDGWAEGISLECTNGPIEVELGRATGDLTASSVNGTVKVQVQVAGAQVQESRAATGCASGSRAATRRSS